MATQEHLVRTGGYRSSIQWRLQQGLGLTLVVFSDSPHATFIERGTNAHIIRPNIKKMLWWEEKPNTAGRGWLVPDPEFPFAWPALRTGVKHPGNRAYMILSRAVRQVFLG